MSPGLLRAREPYKVKNAITGLVMAGFVVGAWAYSMNAVKQDSFEDVDEAARVLAESRAKALEEERGRSLLTAEDASIRQANKSRVDMASEKGRRGVLTELLDRRFPGLLEPTQKTLVWGAPPVDDVGKLWERRKE